MILHLHTANVVGSHRERAVHDDGIDGVIVVLRTHTHALKPDGLVKRLCGLVVCANLEHARLRA